MSKVVRNLLLASVVGLLAVAFVGCSDDDDNDDMMSSSALDPNTAPRASVDRFSDAAGHLFRRSENSALPAANAAINFDLAPFITHGLKPAGGMTSYYNFDVMPTTPAPIYVLIREGQSEPVSGQLNIVDVKPGDSGYNDLWRVHFVTVPATYEANTIHNAAQIMSGGYAIQQADVIVNCPVVPEGSTASMRAGGGSPDLNRGWYKDQVVFYFTFEEAALSVQGGTVPTSPILVCFNVNPDQPNGGPPSGFKAEMGSTQTHNVLATLPGDAGYSPLWSVSAYDMAGFDMVMDWGSAAMVMPSWALGATVNCPVVHL